MASGTLCEVPAFFERNVLPLLTEQSLESMDEDTFGRRAYAWRGRAVIARNLRIKKEL